MTSYCKEIAEKYQLPMLKMNSKYFTYNTKSFNSPLMIGVTALVLIGGYIVIRVFSVSPSMIRYRAMDSASYDWCNTKTNSTNCEKEDGN